MYTTSNLNSRHFHNYGSLPYNILHIHTDHHLHLWYYIALWLVITHRLVWVFIHLFLLGALSISTIPVSYCICVHWYALIISRKEPLPLSRQNNIRLHKIWSFYPSHLWGCSYDTMKWMKMENHQHKLISWDTTTVILCVSCVLVILKYHTSLNYYTVPVGTFPVNISFYL